MVLEFTNNGELYLYNKGFGGQTGGNINTGLTWTDLQQDSWTNLSIVSDLSSQTLPCMSTALWQVRLPSGIHPPLP